MQGANVLLHFAATTAALATPHLLRPKSQGRLVVHVQEDRGACGPRACGCGRLWKLRARRARGCGPTRRCMRRIVQASTDKYDKCFVREHFPELAKGVPYPMDARRTNGRACWHDLCQS